MEDTEKDTKECPLVKREEEEEEPQGFLGLTWPVFKKEMAGVGYVAGPMVAVSLSLSLIHIITMMMVGHLGELALSSSAIAISLSAVTGFSLLAGMAGALETLCGQAYGAQQYRRLGHQTYGAIFCLILVAITVSLLWINMGKLLVLIGQDPLIAHEAGRFTIWLLPTLFANAFYQPLVRYFQTQSLVLPMFISCTVSLAVHVPLCWALIFKTGLKNLGGALAISISNWFNVVILVLYMRFSPDCVKTRVPISMELFREIGEFFLLAVPSAVMACLQWWSYELVTLLSGLLPNPQLETSILSVCQTTIGTFYTIPFGLGAAVSTRVSNELGAGNPRRARAAVFAVMLLAATELIIVSTSLFATRRVFGYMFSNDDEVVQYVSTMAPLICLSVIMDGIQGVLSGVARGCGWQNIGAYVNLASIYLCGLPVSLSLGFWLQFKAKGLWIGNLLGAMVQAVTFLLITSRTDWDEQASKARERIFERKSSVHDLLI